MPEYGKWLPALFALVAFQPYAMATDARSAPAPVAATVDEEEQVDEGLKRFGYLAGLVRRCVVGNQRATLERDDNERRYHRRRYEDDDDFLKGAVVGAAVVGIGVAIAQSNDD